MITARRNDDVTPVCPYCSQPVKDVSYRELSGTFGKRYVYFCSLCHKILGVSHRKGFFMG